MGAQDVSMTIAKQRLTGVQYSVLHALLSVLDFENYIHVHAASLAAEIDIQPKHFSTAVKVLKEKGILIEGPAVGRAKTYRMNPSIAWRGKASNHKKALKEESAKPKFKVLKGGKSEEQQELSL